MTGPLSTTQLRNAWGPPCRFTTAPFTFHTGVTVTVDHRILDACAALDAIFQAHRYRPTSPDCGAYVCRQITGGTGYSLHAYGIAIDINWQANPYSATGRLTTDMPRAMVDQIVALRTRNGAPVWGWGGFYRSIKDAMHYEIVCTPADLATGIANTQPTGGFGTMDDTRILEEFANITKRTGAQIDAALVEIARREKRHNEAARERDAKLLAVLERIAKKIGA